MTDTPDTQDILACVRADLRAAADEDTLASGPRFFKESVRLYGVKTALVSAIAHQYYQKIKGLGKAQIFALCDGLWASGYMEESFVACHWSYALRTDYEPADLDVFERWLADHVGNWASCDTLCNHTIGEHLQRFPAGLVRLPTWAHSPNRWLRRAAAVSLIIPARQGLFAQEVFAIADLLLEDDDDLVRKGYGWLLKAASQAYPQEVFDYVMARKARMPRVALRYAIEKLPADQKAQAMEK